MYLYRPFLSLDIFHLIYLSSYLSFILGIFLNILFEKAPGYSVGLSFFQRIDSGFFNLIFKPG